MSSPHIVYQFKLGWKPATDLYYHFGMDKLYKLTGAVLLNVKVSDERRRCGDACVTFLLGLFRRRRAATCGDASPMRRRCNTDEILRRRRSATQNRRRRVSDAESVTQIGDAESATQSQ